SALDSRPQSRRLRIHACVRRRCFFRVRDGAVERHGGPSTAGGAVKKLRCSRTGVSEYTQTRAIYFPSGCSRGTRGRSESSGRSAWKITAGFCFSHDGYTADEADERGQRAHRRFEEFQSHKNSDGYGDGSSGRVKRIALASERGRMAVLYRWQGTNDGGVDRQSRADDGLSRGRRRVRAEDLAALHREIGRASCRERG